jgi:hypothetical protein
VKSQRVGLARAVNNESVIMTNRLATIATRQRRNRLRDALFAAAVALAAVVSLSTVAAAADAASTHQLASR